ncbi:MAG: hypothetical protein NTW53_03275, partial [Burkholderiales bacterium]|nr:hypothetical protein [Burkholderiales bacterium]
MAHVADTEEVVPSRRVGRRHADPDAKRQSSMMCGPLAQPCAVAGQFERGDRMTAVFAIAHVQADTAGTFPRFECRPDGACEPRVPSPHGLDAFLVDDHVERFAQAIQMVRRRGTVEPLRGRGRVGSRAPVEVAGDTIGPAARTVGTIVEEHERHSGWQHQALLRTGDQHVDAPGVHLDAVAAQR